MHDWMLVSILLDWSENKLSINLKDNQSQQQYIYIAGLRLLNAPRKNDWGKSASINKVTGPSATADGCLILEIEIQSGDIIHVKADSIIMPVSV